MKEEQEKLKFGFGLDETTCFNDTFDSIGELISFALDAYENPDGNYWDEDMDVYPDTIYVGVASTHKPSDYAPSMNDIADWITDAFYCNHNIDNDDVTRVHDGYKAKAEFEHFVNSYFELPCQTTCDWIGLYDLNEKKWQQIWTPNNSLKQEMLSANDTSK